jgi:hypothetical protein
VFIPRDNERRRRGFVDAVGDAAVFTPREVTE